MPTIGCESRVPAANSVEFDLDQIVRCELMADEHATLEENQQMNQAQSPKWMSNGEAGLAVFFSATAFLCLIAAGKALDTAFAFHATLGAAASLWAVFAIFDRYETFDLAVDRVVDAMLGFSFSKMR
jgi:hypothetical protein